MHAIVGRKALNLYMLGKATIFFPRGRFETYTQDPQEEKFVKRDDVISSTFNLFCTKIQKHN